MVKQKDTSILVRHPKNYYTSLDRKQFFSEPLNLDMRDFSEKGYPSIWILKIYYYACDFENRDFI